MNNIERKVSRPSSVAGHIGNVLFRFWHGYTKQESEQFAYWQSIDQLLKIDGKLSDKDWIKAREAELNTPPLGRSIVRSVQPDQAVLAYGRARLEDYCRHQGVLDDGRVVTRVPAHGTDREELAQLGIVADNLVRENVHESSGDDITVILPQGWSMRPAYNPIAGEEFSLGTLNGERVAGVFDQADTQAISIFYNAKPFPYEDSFRSYTHTWGYF